MWCGDKTYIDDSSCQIAEGCTNSWLLSSIYTRMLLRKTNQNLPFIHVREKLPCRLFIYTNVMKTRIDNCNFWICCKSIYFGNGTTSHVSFSSCKERKWFKTGKIRFWHMIFTQSCIKPHPMITELPVLAYSFNSFLPYKTINVNFAIRWAEYTFSKMSFSTLS